MGKTCTEPSHRTSKYIDKQGFKRCRSCRNMRNREWLATHPEAAKQRKEYSVAYKASDEYKTRNHDKIHARSMANTQRLKLLKSSCEDCQATDSLQMHHEDYNKPLEVITLCIICHERRHHEIMV